MGAASLLFSHTCERGCQVILLGVAAWESCGKCSRVWGFCDDASLRIREPFRSEVPPRCGASGRRRAGSAGSTWIPRRSRAPPRGPSSSGSSCSGAPPTGAIRCEDDFSVGDCYLLCNLKHNEPRGFAKAIELHFQIAVQRYCSARTIAHARW